jgi:hypothetical protein
LRNRLFWSELEADYSFVVGDGSSWSVYFPAMDDRTRYRHTLSILWLRTLLIRDVPG